MRGYETDHRLLKTADEHYLIAADMNDVVMKENRNALEGPRRHYLSLISEAVRKSNPVQEVLAQLSSVQQETLSELSLKEDAYYNTWLSLQQSHHTTTDILDGDFYAPENLHLK